LEKFGEKRLKQSKIYCNNFGTTSIPQIQVRYLVQVQGGSVCFYARINEFNETSSGDKTGYMNFNKVKKKNR
jgi:hypothetical protein